LEIIYQNIFSATRIPKQKTFLIFCQIF